MTIFVIVYFFKKASQFDKELVVVTPHKKALRSDIEEIKENLQKNLQVSK